MDLAGWIGSNLALCPNACWCDFRCELAIPHYGIKAGGGCDRLTCFRGRDHTVDGVTSRARLLVDGIVETVAIAPPI